MTVRSVLFCCCITFAVSPVPSVAADWPPMDHGGVDFVPANGDRVWGIHTGVGTFRITSATTVSVKPFDGITTTGAGAFEVFADSIEVAGTLDATGCGLLRRRWWAVAAVARTLPATFYRQAASVGPAGRRPMEMGRFRVNVVTTLLFTSSPDCRTQHRRETAGRARWATDPNAERPGAWLMVATPRRARTATQLSTVRPSWAAVAPEEPAAGAPVPM